MIAFHWATTHSNKKLAVIQKSVSKGLVKLQDT